MDKKLVHLSCPLADEVTIKLNISILKKYTPQIDQQICSLQSLAEFHLKFLQYLIYVSIK